MAEHLLDSVFALLAMIERMCMQCACSCWERPMPAHLFPIRTLSLLQLLAYIGSAAQQRYVSRWTNFCYNARCRDAAPAALQDFIVHNKGCLLQYRSSLCDKASFQSSPPNRYNRASAATCIIFSKNHSVIHKKILLYKARPLVGHILEIHFLEKNWDFRDTLISKKSL